MSLEEYGAMNLIIAAQFGDLYLSRQWLLAGPFDVKVQIRVMLGGTCKGKPSWKSRNYLVFFAEALNSRSNVQPASQPA